MTRHTFELLPTVNAPPGAIANPLTDIKWAASPPPALEAIFEQLTGSYSEIQKALSAADWLELYDTGILQKLDAISLPGKTGTDILVNFGGGLSGQNFGGGFVSGGGIVLDGVDDYINTRVNPSTSSLFERNSCSYGIMIADATGITSSGYLVGMDISGLDNVIRPKNSGGSGFPVAIQSTSVVTVPYTGVQTGLFAVDRSGANDVSVLKDGSVIYTNSAYASTVERNGNFLIGRQSGSYGAMRAAGWYFGAHLTTDQHALIYTIMMRRLARMLS